MNKELFKQLCLNFSKEPSIELHKLWNEELRKYDPLYVEKAVRNIIIKDRFMPSLSRVIEEIGNIPFIQITEEEKRKRMAQKGIKPSWLDKEIKLEKAAAEEQEEMKRLLNEMMGG